MKRLALALAVVGLAFPTSAGAHSNVTWYWATGKAEARIYSTYSDVIDVYCEGVGTPYKKRLYRHHDCDLYIDDGDVYSVRLHVLGRNKFKIAW